MLVVIGLILGGILVGRDLIEAAKIRRAISEVENLKTAVHAFKLKYDALPGDMKNATQFWGTDTGCPQPSDLTTLRIQTCNGDGDGRISGDWDMTESFHAIQQLGAAGLIPGNYTGTYANTGYTETTRAGVNILPLSAFSSGALVLESFYGVTPACNTHPACWHWSTGTGNFIALFKEFYGNSNTSFYETLLTPQQALTIDTKYDDGKPGTGNMVNLLMAFYNGGGAGSGCSTNGHYSASTYNIAVTAVTCSLSIKLGL